jgi:hypothetical protein
MGGRTLVRNVGHFHNCKYLNLSDRLYRITTVKTWKLLS